MIGTTEMINVTTDITKTIITTTDITTIEPKIITGTDGSHAEVAEMTKGSHMVEAHAKKEDMTLRNKVKTTAVFPTETESVE